LEYPRLDKEITFYGLVRKIGRVVFIEVPREVRERKVLEPGDIVRVNAVKVAKYER